MSKKIDPSVYQVTTQEDPETGDLLLPIPPELLEKLGWKEGDELDFSKDDKGRIVLQKVIK